MKLEDMIPIAEYARRIGKATITVADKCRRGAIPVEEWERITDVYPEWR